MVDGGATFGVAGGLVFLTTGVVIAAGVWTFGGTLLGEDFLPGFEVLVEESVL